MELLADRDPEEARQLLDPVLERMMDAVHRYEGTVNQVMGDGIMALFGAPLAHEDHAVRACYAALRMQESLKLYAEDTRRSHGVELQIRVGLNSGEVVVRAVGSDLRMDYTAVGQTTHLAARMEQIALPGTVRLTAETMRLAEGYVEVRSLGPIPVKGLPAPIEIFELTGAGTARTRLQAAALRGLTRFVGRDAEVEHLRRVLGQAGAGRGQVVAIVGEAGVGKSRLTYEFTHSHRVQDWLILEASSVSYGKATSYLPVIDLLKGYFRIGERDDHREMRAKVLGRVLGLDRALEPLLPPLLALLDVPVEDAAWQNLDPPQRRRRTLDVVKRLLLRESQVQPLLVVFEDLHWIDGETQALLDSLVESLGSARLLLLVNYRPEYDHRWGSKTAYSQLRLDTLPTESAAELLAALLGPDPGLAPLMRMLVKRGNPFFLEETVRTLVETEALAGERGAYRLTRPVETLQVPATVQTILAARIDRLLPEEKRLLQAASVIGKDVPYALLAAIAEQPEEILRPGLAHLQESEFLYETRLFPDLEFTFKHALTHEVAYAGLLGERRRALHAAVTAAIERLHADRLVEHVEHLALHASRAHAWEHAARYGRQAGTKAMDRCAYPQAARYFEGALEALAHLPDGRQRDEMVFDARLALSSPLSALGQLERCLALNDEDVRSARVLGDAVRTVRASLRRMNLLSMLGDPAGGLPHAMEALRVAESIDDTVLQATANWVVGQARQLLGDYPQAIEVLRRNLALLPGEMRERRFSGNMSLGLTSQSWLAFCLAELGEFGQATALGDDAMSRGEALGHTYSYGMAAWGRAYTALLRGELSKAVTTYERTLAMYREAGIINLVPPWSAGLGYARVLSGSLPEGVASLEYARGHIADNRYLEAQFLAWLAHGQALVGRSSEAVANADTALALATQGQQRGQEAWALTILGDIWLLASPRDGDRAADYFNRAIQSAQALGMRPLLAHCHLGLGKLYGRTGKREQASEHLTTATAMYREMDMPFRLKQAEAEISELA
jgi:class 3 adenylate cyclase/tetratricopeptide (TPR) repeat protein